MPFVTVFPRCNVDCIPPLPLAYTNDGPGHYDVLIPAEHFPSDSSADNGSKTAGKVGDKTACISRSQNTNLNRRQGSYCRCGINTNRKSLKKSLRKYKSRCGCIIHSLKCSRNCRCKGVCGGTACKEEETIQDSSPKYSRQTRKRGKNPIQTTPDKKMIISSEVHERPNTLEYFIILYIVNCFSGS